MSRSTGSQADYPDVFIDPLIARPDDGGMRAYDRILKYCLVAVLFLSPIPLGSHRPVFWAFWALVLSLLLIWYCFMLHRTAARPRVGFDKIGLPSILFGLVLVFMAIQCMPIGSYLGSFVFSSQSGAILTSNTLSLTPGDTVLSVLRWSSYGFLFFLMLQVGARARRARWMTKALIIIVLIEAVYALVALTQFGDVLLFLPKEYYRGSATGTFVNRNSLATYLGLGAIIATSLLLRPSESGRKSGRRGNAINAIFDIRMEKIWTLLALAFLMIALIATQSRMGIMSSLAGIMTVLLLRLSQLTHSRFVVLAFPVLLVLILVIFGAGVADRFIDIMRSFDQRLSIYDQVAEMIRDRPLLGFGAGSFNHAFPLYHDLPVPTNFVYDRAHSTYLEHWVDMGLIFGSMPILSVLLLAWPLMKQTASKGRLRTEVIAALGATVTVALHSLFDFSLEIEAVVFLYLSILAIALGSHLAGGVSRNSGQVPKATKGTGQRRAQTHPVSSARPRLHFPSLPAAVYAIGDVHGRLDLLLALEERIIADAAPIDGEKWIILLGDFVDRGPQTAELIEHILAPAPEGFKRFAIAGNHEVMMQAFLEKEPGTSRWIGFGGDETLRSYGFSLPEVDKIAQGGSTADYLLSSQIPEGHVRFLRELPDALITPDYIFLHIGLNETHSIAQEVDLAASLSSDERDGSKQTMIVHGHRVVSEPVVRGNQINVDTGAYETGRLSAARIVPGKPVAFLDSEGAMYEA